MNHQQYNSHIIWKSFIIMSILQIIPYPTKLFYFPKPSWLCLILIYWVTKVPNRMNIGSGFVVGLITDILSGPILGIRAITLSIIIYFLLVKLPIFCNMLKWKQGLAITLFSFIIHLIIYLIYTIVIDNIAFYPKAFLNDILLNSMIDGIIWIGILLIMCKINTNKKFLNIQSSI